MPQVANIVLNDALATPVAHIFIPLGPDNKGVWWFEDQTGTSAVGFQRLSLSVVRPPLALNGQKNQSERINRVRIGFYLPRLETLSTGGAGFVPAPTVAYVEKASLEVMIPDRATLQDRKDIQAFLKNILSNSLVTSAFETLQPLY